MLNIGDLVKPSFSSSGVYLFSISPTREREQVEEQYEQPRLWNNLSKGIILERDAEWVRILTQEGVTGWIGTWNVTVIS